MIQNDGSLPYPPCTKLIKYLNFPQSIYLDDLFLYVGCSDGSIQLFENKGKFAELDQIRAHKLAVNQLARFEDLLVSTSLDKIVCLYDIKEIQSKIRERKAMHAELLWSTQYNAYYEVMNKKKKKQKDLQKLNTKTLSD